MSRPGEHWLGDPVLEPDWRHPLVMGAVAAAVLGAVVVTVVLALRAPRELGDGLVFATAGLAVPAPLSVVVVSLRRRPRGDAGQVLLRAGYHAPVLVPGAVVAGVLALVVGAVKPDRGRYGLDYALGGSALGLLAGGLVGAVVLLIVGASVRFPLANPALPWHLRLSIPLVLTSMVVMALGAALGVDPDVDLPRRLAGLVVALSGEAGVASAAWLWVGRAGAAGFLVGLALVGVALRDRRAVRLT